jgi:hypothetical protein
MSYEGKMARSSLKKAIAYSTELLGMIKPTDELEPWVQNKINDIDHYIESIYGYYKFSDDEESSEEKEMEEMGEMMESENSDSTNSQQITIGDYTTRHFDICPSAQALYSNIRGKTDMIHLIVETMMLQDLFFRLEKQAIAMGSIDEEEYEKAEEFAELIMDNAERMGLAEEHSYINDVHMAKFRQLAGMPENDEGDDEEEDEEEGGENDMLENGTFRIVLTPES